MHRDGVPFIRLGMAVIFFVFVLGLIFGSWYTVDPTERAGVRRLGTVETVSPISPGLHFKVPFIDTVDKIQVSRSTLHVEPFTVNTIDNQIITLSVNVTYEVPEDAVFYLLYNVGQSGNFDVKTSILPVIRDQIGRVVASKNTTTFSANRDEIQNETLTHVGNQLKSLFKLSLLSIQFDAITYSNAFIESNNTAVLAKNKAIQEENNKKVVEYQAQQKVIVAEGLSREQVVLAEAKAKATVAQAQAENTSTILRAEADNKATILKAQAEKQTLELRGQGESSRLSAEANALGGPERYIELQRTMAYRNWNGSVPSMQISGPNAPPMLFTMPLPTGK